MKKVWIVILALLLLLPTALTVCAEEPPTDEELYAEIDRDLRTDRMRGELSLCMNEALSVEEWVSALQELGIPTDFDCEYLYTHGQVTDPGAWTYGSFTVMVPEELLRELLFKANRSEAFESVGVNAVEYPDVIEHPIGDANYDYEVDARDYMAVKRYVLGTLGADSFGEELADVNYDGEVDARDYMILKKVILGKGELSDRPAPRDMTEKQLEHWLDDVMRYAENYGEMILFLQAGVTAEDALAAIGGECDLLYSSEVHYPGHALWLVIDLSDADYRETIRKVALCDLLVDWNLGRDALVTFE